MPPPAQHTYASKWETTSAGQLKSMPKPTHYSGEMELPLRDLVRAYGSGLSQVQMNTWKATTNSAKLPLRGRSSNVPIISGRFMLFCGPGLKTAKSVQKKKGSRKRSHVASSRLSISGVVEKFSCLLRRSSQAAFIRNWSSDHTPAAIWLRGIQSTAGHRRESLRDSCECVDSRYEYAPSSIGEGHGGIPPHYTVP